MWSRICVKFPLFHTNEINKCDVLVFTIPCCVENSSCWALLGWQGRKLIRSQVGKISFPKPDPPPCPPCLSWFRLRLRCQYFIQESCLHSCKLDKLAVQRVIHLLQLDHISWIPLDWTILLIIDNDRSFSFSGGLTDRNLSASVFIFHLSVTLSPSFLLNFLVWKETIVCCKHHLLAFIHPCFSSFFKLKLMFIML